MKAPRLDLEQYVVEDKVDEAVITHKASGQTWVLDTDASTDTRASRTSVRNSAHCFTSRSRASGSGARWTRSRTSASSPSA